MEKKKKFDERPKMCYTDNSSVQGARCPLETLTPVRAEIAMEIELMQIVLACISGRDLTRQEIKAFRAIDGGLSALKELERRIHFQAAAVANFEPESALGRWREATGADLEVVEEEVAA